MTFSKDNASFRNKLLQWYSSHKRNLPWRNSSDPYKIWLSEIILQQTRVQQGLPYYQEFTNKFPTVHHLAQASEEEVLRTWQGLGYYSRARNLHKCARLISERFGGHFPATYESLLKLPGVGPYTAAAIASFAFSKPHAVVDGNVYRVLSRIFGIRKDIASSAGQRHFSKVANTLIDPDHPADFNQAIMEFGALHCTPSSPKCPSCVFQDLCYAFERGAQQELPVKKQKPAVRRRYFNYVVVRSGEKYGLRPRTTKDIWKGLYDFPLVETATFLGEEEILDSLEPVTGLKENVLLHSVSPDYVHQLSHQRLHARFFLVETNAGDVSFSDPSVRLFGLEEIHDLPKPVLISRYLNDYIF